MAPLQPGQLCPPPLPSPLLSYFQTILAIIRCILEHGKEDVILLTHPSEPAYSAEDMLEVSRLCEGVGQHRLQVWLMKTDRSSMRDRAPTFVVSKSLPEVRGVAWNYSG